MCLDMANIPTKTMRDFLKEVNVLSSDDERKANSLEELSSITSGIVKQVLKTYQMNEKYYDGNKIKADFNPGGIVHRRNFVTSDSSKNFSEKLAPKYLRCKIIKKKSPMWHTNR